MRYILLFVPLLLSSQQSLSQVDAQLTWPEIDSIIEQLGEKGLYSQMLPYAERQAQLAGQDSTLLIKSLYNLASARDEMNNFASAENLYIKCLQLQEKLFGRDSIFAAFASKLGLLYTSMDFPEAADSLLNLSYELRLNIFGPKHPKVAISQSDISVFWVQLEDFEAADSILSEALSTLAILGEGHPDYINALSNIGSVREYLNDFRGADSIYAKVEVLTISTHGYFHPYTVDIKNHRGALLHRRGKPQEAVPFYLEALSILEKSQNTYVSNYPRILGNLSVAYDAMDKLERALDYAKYSLKTWWAQPEHDTFQIIIQTNNLASIFRKLGEPGSSDSLYRQAIEMQKRKFGNNDTNLAILYNNYSGFQQEVGLFEEELINMRQARHILEKTIGMDNLNYAIILNNLGEAYSHNDSIESAREMMEKSFQIRKKLLGDNNPSLATPLHNLGRTWAKESFPIAENYYEQARGLAKKGTIAYCTIIHNMANLYLDNDDYSRAETLYLECKEMLEEIVGKEHRDYISLVQHIGELYLAWEKLPEAEIWLGKAAQLRINQLARLYPILSEYERLKWLNTIRPNFYSYYLMATKRIENNLAIAKDIFDLQLAFDGRALETSVKIRQALVNSRDSLTRETYLDWLSARRELAKAYQMSTTELKQNNINPGDLQTRVLNLEKQASRYSGAFVSKILNPLGEIHYEHVKSALNSGEVLINYFSFPLHNGKKWTDTILYYALVVKPEYNYPHLVRLGNSSVLKDWLDAPISLASNTNYVVNPQIAYEIYKHMWQPLLPALEGIKTVHIVPSNDLYKINFSILPIDLTGKKLLSDYYKFVFHNVMRDLIKLEPESSNINKQITLIGGALYDLSAIERVDALAKIREEVTYEISSFSSSTEAAISPLSGRRSGLPTVFSTLPGSLTEVNEIASSALSAGWSVKKFTDKEALEEIVKIYTANLAPAVLHLSVHSFYFDRLPDSVKLSSEELRQKIFTFSNPLLRTGLVFSGANYVWKGGASEAGVEDGILNGVEVSDLDLQNTRLAVLSSCLSGRGEADDKEGIIGLVRAFRYAGVSNLLVSLWEIPDEHTALLMHYFYKLHFSGKSPRESLRFAQAKMRKRYPPYFWAGFILIE